MKQFLILGMIIFFGATQGFAHIPEVDADKITEFTECKNILTDSITHNNIKGLELFFSEQTNCSNIFSIDIIDPDIDGKTALMRASERGYTKIAKALIDAGADLNIQDEDKNTALIWASWQGHIQLAKALIDAGADVNIQGEDKYTALARALVENHDEIAKMLIDAGAERQG